MTCAFCPAPAETRCTRAIADAPSRVRAHELRHGDIVRLRRDYKLLASVIEIELPKFGYLRFNVLIADGRKSIVLCTESREVTRFGPGPCGRQACHKHYADRGLGAEMPGAIVCAEHWRMHP